MERTIRLFLGMVVTGIFVIFLLNYLSVGTGSMREGIWSDMQRVEIPQYDKPAAVISDSAEVIISEDIPEIFLTEESCAPNKAYALHELFGNAQGKRVYLDVEAVFLGEKDVLAKGDAEELMQQENPPAAVCGERSGTLWFTRQGSYRVELIVGTRYGRKPCRRISVTVLVLSGERLNT